jgi:hypothetical protein
MKVIDAYWEKRNLDVDCVEIIIEKTDTIEDLRIINQIANNKYVVVKVPSVNFEVNNYLSELGFVFIECSLNLEINIKNLVLSDLQKRINNDISYCEMEISDLDELYNEIKKGLFKTDRVNLDSKFNKEQSSIRYINWIKDELDRKSKIYKVKYKNEIIGFFSLKSISEEIYYPFLAGLYSKFSNSGLGFTLLTKPIEEIASKHGKKIITFVSSNNLPILRNHLDLGFKISELCYVFVKH